MDKKQCIKNCTNENEYIYEYKNYCYKACPNGTMELDIMPFFCISICTKEFPFKLIKSDDCVQYCPISDIRSNNCELYYKENNTNIEDKIIYCIQQDLTKGYNTSEVEDGNDVIIDRNNFVYIITSTINQQKESNRPTINFGNCETSLKYFYNISKEEPLYILEIVVNIPFMKIPKIEYEVYYLLNSRNLTKLDLSICKNDKIEIILPLSINDTIDKYNPKSDYYNDICYTFTSESGTDILLNDRKEEFIDNNMTLCEENCTFVRYDYINNKSICSCEVKIKLPLISEITIDKTWLYNSFTDINNIANIYILKCYKLLLSKEGILKNIGFFILMPIIILFIIAIIVFYVFDYKKFKMKIELIIYAKNNYDKLKNIYDKIRNKNKKRINNNKNKNIFESSNKITKSNNYLIKENKIKTKKVKNESSDKNTKNNLKTQCLILNNKSSKEKKTKKNKEKKNPKTNKSTPIKNKRIKSLEDKLNVSGLNDAQKFEKVQNILVLNDYEKNNLEYNLAKKLDKRSYTQYYISLLKTKHLFIFSFIQNKDYNSKVIKIILFFFILTINFTISTLFFNDSTMHVIYLEKGQFNFIYQIPQIIYSSLISGVLTAIFRYLSLTEKTVLSLKNEKNLHIF